MGLAGESSALLLSLIWLPGLALWQMRSRLRTASRVWPRNLGLGCTGSNSISKLILAQSLA